MASIKTQPVLGDVGSQQIEQLIHSYNHLLDVLGDLITGLKTAADVTAQKALAVTAEAALVANVFKQQTKPAAPLGRRFATK